MVNPRGMTIYSEHWNLKPLEIPQRSRLFSLEPVALGTPYTESLSSYLHRLAQAHSVNQKVFSSGRSLKNFVVDDTFYSANIEPARLG
ncbi:hypothetical protein AABK37_40375, partial [Hassallia sp. VBCCA 56010]